MSVAKMLLVHDSLTSTLCSTHTHTYASLFSFLYLIVVESYLNGRFKHRTIEYSVEMLFTLHGIKMIRKMREKKNKKRIMNKIR